MKRLLVAALNVCVNEGAAGSAEGKVCQNGELEAEAASNVVDGYGAQDSRHQVWDKREITSLARTKRLGFLLRRRRMLGGVLWLGSMTWLLF